MRGLKYALNGDLNQCSYNEYYHYYHIYIIQSTYIKSNIYEELQDLKIHMIVKKNNSKNTLNHFITEVDRIIRILDNMTDSYHTNIKETVWVQLDTPKTFMSSRVDVGTHLVHP